MRVRMEVVNAVTDVVIDAAALPADGASVGVGVGLRVDLITQDDAPVPWEAAAAGLTLSLTPPGAARRPSSPALAPVQTNLVL